MIPLLTSVPPSFTRRTLSGSNFGQEYLSKCVTSWHDNGFTPISINSKREISAFPHLYGLLDSLNIKSLIVDRDASEVAGKPLPYLEDFLKQGSQVNSGQGFIITNSDILFSASLDAKYLTSLPDYIHFAYAHRQDMISPTLTENTSSHETFLDGIDFFYLRSVPRISSRLIFGLPWWDLFLPAAAIINNIPTSILCNAKLYHLNHDERWNPFTRNDMLKIMISDIEYIATTETSLYFYEILEIAKTRSSSVFPNSNTNMFMYLKHLTKQLIPSYRRFVNQCESLEFSNQIANLNLGFIRANSKPFFS